jgi:hypothetical protein
MESAKRAEFVHFEIIAVYIFHNISLPPPIFVEFYPLRGGYKNVAHNRDPQE